LFRSITGRAPGAGVSAPSPSAFQNGRQVEQPLDRKATRTKPRLSLVAIEVTDPAGVVPEMAAGATLGARRATWSPSVLAPAPSALPSSASRRRRISA